MGLCNSTTKSQLCKIEEDINIIKNTQYGIIRILQQQFLTENESNNAKDQIWNTLNNNINRIPDILELGYTTNNRNVTVFEEKPNIYVYYDKPITVVLEIPTDEIIYIYPNSPNKEQLPGVTVNVNETEVAWTILDPSILRYLFWEGRNLLQKYTNLVPDYIFRIPIQCVELGLSQLTKDFTPDERLDFMTFWMPKLLPLNMHNRLEIKIYINNHPRPLKNSAGIPIYRFYMMISIVKSIHTLELPQVKLNRPLQDHHIFEWGGSIDPREPEFHIPRKC